MIVCFEKIHEFSIDKVEFYTIKLGNNELTEFELFVEKDFPNHTNEIEILYNVIEAMKTKGAKFHFFKDEANANALPIVPTSLMDSNKIDFGLRLYCIRITDNLVVLLNGNIKTHKNPALCENVKKHFKNALKIATKLDSLRFRNEINFLETNCLTNIEFEI